MPEFLTATVHLPGSCGELVQGSYNGTTFHVTCPVDIYSTVTVTIAPGMGRVKGPANCPKAATAVGLALEYLSCRDRDVELSIASSLPPGKGMASSTADVAGAIIATGLALGRPLAPGEVASIALNVEPSDGTFFPGIVAFDHRQGGMHLELGPPPPMDILVLDFGGEVDTIAFNQQDRSDTLRRLEPQAQRALELVRQGVAVARPELIGEGATLSALANQEILYKPQLDRVLELARQVNALGVNVAHSGTVIGVLLDPQRHDVKSVGAFLRRNLVDLRDMHFASLVGGGARSGIAPYRQSLDAVPVRTKRHC